MFLEFLSIGIVLLILVAIFAPFGGYMARVFQGEKTWLDPLMSPLESRILQLFGTRPHRSMTGWQYARAVLYSNLAMGIFVFLILIFQGFLPLNPTGLTAPSWDLALHTTISFVTNTNQQHYSGETTYTYASQMWGLGYLMFTSAATGIAVAIAFIRGLSGKPLGNFYLDLTLAITRILLPISLVGAIVLLGLGVPETLAGPAIATTLEGQTQYIARGPVAHFEIIKELGENGGGFFGINSAHPYENPNNLTNLIENVIMLCIPVGLIYTYGAIAGNKKQGWLIFWMVWILFAILVGISAIAESQGNPEINALLGSSQPNLEGKETRFGWALTALWAVSTTGTMCGAVNGMHDSLMPLSGFTTLSNLFLQIVWGGQGTGTAYLFVYLILTVFLTGLMVGRTPELFGRKIEKREIVLASIILLVHPIAILIPGAITLAFPETLAGITNPGFHGLSQVVYEYASAAANNGSGFEGLDDDTLWWNLSASFSLLAGRYIPIIALLLLADSLSRKQPVPETPGTLRTDSILFTSVTAGAIVILGALTFFPVLTLGPIAEGFQLATGL
ncbi:potassium-transporting ATPase subunit A [Desertifilum sp. FACHB-1129]|uniref:Potassium-transporting ATPase potassium-binding subunit n=1 Tax=Desertifilum tharense IPPAS B-1220 TaxID=1781255 RepID=A0A1E5QNP1_9CYAN|nr:MULTISPECIES: potassium-transporting ATPase subunit KdpA [Desertifilum]MDA0212237.1 potassium-transporting ATPase subunit KdpA [Cyanobacteria bacterium FC1]MBD2312816.1 potassium-transporting ATPase subunit A [Desertifilum sp. FACHB-1129]MBD2324180.1 potassium-transporting ATPase subunit A [Desertifilum sp. FACHB-866]MBD2334194.1 potassium-transporting ATPase subunit A [Desertifilum sp. FACHB-868]OEJ76258.1 potassium-transporting ATPase subunit KdpA [Desertifilum tharense IPPAS B-1220]